MTRCANIRSPKISIPGCVTQVERSPQETGEAVGGEEKGAIALSAEASNPCDKGFQSLMDLSTQRYHK
jgi:hypothetical protein